MASGGAATDATHQHPIDEKNVESVQHVDNINAGNLVYDDDDEEPEIHARTWIALAAMFLLNFVQVLALQGPPAVLSFIGKDLNNTTAQTWIPNSLSLVQAVISPIMASASDTFQARKAILVSFCIISFIGAAIAPGSHNIYRLIVAQILIGFGFALVPLAYSVPSEILPKRWRPMVQAIINIAAALGAIVGPLIIGSLTNKNPHTGWRNFYWIQMSLWALTAIGIFIGYKPPKRHTSYDYLTRLQKINHLDLPGFGLLTAGLTLLLTGLNLGGGLYKWSSTPTLATLIIGCVLLLAFGLYEWKGTSTGIVHHDLFRGGSQHGRTFAVLLGLMFAEGLLLFSYLIFYPVMTTSLFETNALKLVGRETPFWIASGLVTVIYGYAASRFRNIKIPLLVGFVLFTAGVVGWATIQPDDSTSAIVFSGLAGLGFGAPLVLIVSGVQLCTPHHLIATATGLTTSTRAVAATMFTAIYSAALTDRLNKYIPGYIAKAALSHGLPETSLPQFIGALADDNTAILPTIPGINASIIEAGLAALKQAFADGLRVIYIIAAPLGVLACLGCLFIGDLKPLMNYHVDAPVEALHAKNRNRINAV